MRRFQVRLPALLILLSLTGCQTQLYTHLSERDAMEMTAILLHNGISADRVIAKDGSSTIEVAGSQVADAVSVLRASHYPRNDYESMDKIFQQQGMISTPTAERAKLYYGISQELGHTLNDIDGVIDARVHIAPAVNDPVTGIDKPATASVVIRYDAGTSMTGLLPKIKLMVANAVQDLAYDRVSVILLPEALPHLPQVQISNRMSLPGLLGWFFALLFPCGYGVHYWLQRRKNQTSDTGSQLTVSPRQTP